MLSSWIVFQRNNGSRSEEEKRGTYWQSNCTKTACMSDQIRLAHLVGQRFGAILSEQEIRSLCIAFA
jgi:hypothetical protein